MELDIDSINQQHGNDPEALTRWALSLGKRAICTTNFRPFEAVILHMVTQVQPDIPVVWICLLYTSPSPRDRSLSRMPSSA